MAREKIRVGGFPTSYRLREKKRGRGDRTWIRRPALSRIGGEKKKGKKGMEDVVPYPRPSAGGGKKEKGKSA